MPTPAPRLISTGELEYGTESSLFDHYLIPASDTLYLFHLQGVPPSHSGQEG